MPASTDIDAFWAAWPLFEDAVLTGVVSGVLLGVLGVYIVLGRMVFLSAALSQMAGFGVTLAYAAQAYLGVAATLASPTLGAALMTLLSLALIWRNDEQQRARRDSMLGIIFLLGAAGTLMVASKIVQELHDVKTLLFGSSVAVLPEDFRVVAIMAACILFLHVWWWRGCVEVIYDEETARVRGVPVSMVKLMMILTIALAVSICTRVMGALPAFAFSVFPAMSAIAVSRNIPWAMAVAAIVGAASGFLGYLVAFLYEFPVGPSQAMVGMVIWCFCLIFGRLARGLRSILGAAGQADATKGG
jgi:zinc transport system permease protein